MRHRIVVRTHTSPFGMGTSFATFYTPWQLFETRQKAVSLNLTSIGKRISPYDSPCFQFTGRTTYNFWTGAEWFLAKNMEALLNSLDGLISVHYGRTRDGNSLEGLFLFQHLLIIKVSPYTAELLFGGIEFCLDGRADCNQLSLGGQSSEMAGVSHPYFHTPSVSIAALCLWKFSKYGSIIPILPRPTTATWSLSPDISRLSGIVLERSLSKIQYKGSLFSKMKSMANCTLCENCVWSPEGKSHRL